GVAEDPVGHVSAVTGAQRAFAVFINKPIMRFSVVEALHQIFIGSAAPVAVNRVNKLLPVSGRAVKVDEHDYVSIRSKKLKIPAVAPLISHGDFGTTVNDELHRILLVGIKVRRLDQKAFDFIVVGASEPEGLER